MKELKIEDFKKVDIGVGHYYTWSNEKIEVCLELCFSGYDIAIYDKNQSLIGEKTCTNMINLGGSIVLEYAVKIANKKIKELGMEKW